MNESPCRLAGAIYMLWGGERMKNCSNYDNHYLRYICHGTVPHYIINHYTELWKAMACVSCSIIFF